MCRYYHQRNFLKLYLRNFLEVLLPEKFLYFIEKLYLRNFVKFLLNYQRNSFYFLLRVSRDLCIWGTSWRSYNQKKKKLLKVCVSEVFHEGPISREILYFIKSLCNWEISRRSFHQRFLDFIVKSVYLRNFLKALLSEKFLYFIASVSEVFLQTPSIRGISLFFESLYLRYFLKVLPSDHLKKILKICVSEDFLEGIILDFLKVLLSEASVWKQFTLTKETIYVW